MEEKLKLISLRKQIECLKQAREQRKLIKEFEYNEDIRFWVHDQQRSLINLTAVSLTAILLSSTLAIAEIKTDHKATVCPVSRIISIFSEEAALNHRLKCIEKESSSNNNFEEISFDESLHQDEEIGTLKR